ncbi:hypothetical protein FQZ97_749630 [compost metagenome]
MNSGSRLLICSTSAVSWRYHATLVNGANCRTTGQQTAVLAITRSKFFPKSVTLRFDCSARASTMTSPPALTILSRIGPSSGEITTTNAPSSIRVSTISRTTRGAPLSLKSCENIRISLFCSTEGRTEGKYSNGSCESMNNKSLIFLVK